MARKRGTLTEEQIEALERVLIGKTVRSEV
jgi:hypothetical protein